MNPPDPVNAFNGMSQGAEGFAQGNIGSSVGRSQGPSLGINRAATGGPNMDQSAPQPQGPNVTAGGATAPNATRHTSDFWSSFLPIAAVAANFIPGVGPIVSAGLGAVSSQISKNAAQHAANAALGNQSALAGQMATGASLSPLITQEKAGITSAVNNSNAANPGKLLMDLFGGAITNAIGGVSSNRLAGQEAAAGIYGGQGTAAQQSAAAAPNPFTSIAGMLPGASGLSSSGATAGPANGAPGSFGDFSGGVAAAFPGVGGTAPAVDPMAGLESSKVKTGAGSK
jgi:hypothetical protein